MNKDIFDELTTRGDAQSDSPESSEDDRLNNAGHTEPTPLDAPVEAPSDATPQAIKHCCQTLLKQGLLEADREAALYQTALASQSTLRRLLEPFDLDLALDDTRGLAFLTVRKDPSDTPDQDEWSHPLVRRQRLTLEQSLLVAILRKRFLIHEKEAGIGAGGARVFIDELVPELQIYLPDLGSDVKEEDRARSLLEKLKGHGIVSALDDKDQITIRPIIAHLANPENLQALLEQYLRLSEQESP